MTKERLPTIKNETYLFITKNFPPTVCGVGDYTYNLTKELMKLGEKVHVLTSCNQQVIKSEMEITSSIEGFALMKIPRIIRSIKKINPEAINLQYVPQMTGVFGFSIMIGILTTFIRLFTKYGLTVTLHELFISLKGNVFIKTIGLVQRLNLLMICLSAHSLIVATEERKRYLHKFFPKKRIHVAPVGSNIPRIAISNHEREELRNKYAQSSEIIFSTFGTASRDKNYISIVEIMKELYSQNIPSKLLMIGDIERDPKVFKEITNAIKKKNLESRIYITGKLDKAEISKLLQISDLFIVNQRKGIGTGSGTLAASFSHGIPVIANLTDNVDPHFKNRENLFLVPMLDPKVAASDIGRLLKDKELIERVGAKAEEFSQNCLSWEGIAKIVSQAECGIASDKSSDK